MAKSKPKPAYGGWLNSLQRDARLESREVGEVNTTARPFSKNADPIPKLTKLEQHAQNLGAEIYDRLQEKYKKKANKAK